MRPWRTIQVKCSRRSEEHTSELQSRLVISYAVFCLKQKKIDDDVAVRARHGHRTIKDHTNLDIEELCYHQSVLDLVARLDHDFFFLTDPQNTEIYTTRHTLSLHDALPISGSAQNFVYADTTGNIGWYAAGRIPIRA